MATSDDWYARLLETRLLDTLAPYDPVIVGPYPLGLQTPHSRIEVVCRAVDLTAFARLLEHTYGGDDDGLALHPGELDGEPAVFAEFELDGLPLEVSAQGQHVHRRLGAATLGIVRMFEEEGEVRRSRMAAAVQRGEVLPERMHAYLRILRSLQAPRSGGGRSEPAGHGDEQDHEQP
jgi:hypothetical protein